MLDITLAGVVVGGLAGIYIGGWLADSGPNIPADAIEEAYLQAMLEADLEPGNLRDLRYLDGTDAVLAQLRKQGYDLPLEGDPRQYQEAETDD